MSKAGEVFLFLNLGNKMSLQITVQNIAQVKSGIIGHGVNCQGVMGSGVAQQLRDKYPQIYDSYVVFCQQHYFPSERLGLVDFIAVSSNLTIANMFTQEFYGKDGKVYASSDAIRKTLIRVANKASRLKCNVFVPQIGCGLGGLDWNETVLPIFNDVVQLFPEIDIVVCNLPPNK